MFQTAMSRAAPIPNNDVNAQTSLTAVLSSQDPSSSLAHPASCQSSKMSTVNYEKAITKHIQTLYSSKRVCELQNYPPSKKVINRCHQQLRWALDEFHNFGSRKAEHRRSNYYKYYLIQFLCSILAYVNLTLYFRSRIFYWSCAIWRISSG